MLSDSKEVYTILKSQKYQSSVFQYLPQNQQSWRISQSLKNQDQNDSNLQLAERQNYDIQNRIIFPQTSSPSKLPSDQDHNERNNQTRRFLSTPKSRSFSELIGDYDEKLSSMQPYNSVKKENRNKVQATQPIAGQVLRKQQDEFKITASYQIQEKKLKDGMKKKASQQSLKLKSPVTSSRLNESWNSKGNISNMSQQTQQSHLSKQQQNYNQVVSQNSKNVSKSNGKQKSSQRQNYLSQSFQLQNQNLNINGTQRQISQNSSRNFSFSQKPYNIDQSFNTSFSKINQTERQQTEQQRNDTLSSVQNSKIKELFLFGISQFLDIQLFKDLLPHGMSLLKFNYQNQTITTSFKGRAKILIQFNQQNSEVTDRSLLKELTIRLAARGIKVDQSTPKYRLQQLNRIQHDPRQMIAHSPSRKTSQSLDLSQISDSMQMPLQ